MVVDASAVVAIALNEPEAGRLATAIFGSARRLIAMPTLLEITLVVGGRTGMRGTGRPAPGSSPASISRRWPSMLAIWPSPRRLGGSSARDVMPPALNFGDCFSYALAKIENEPLLFKGADFAPDRHPSGAIGASPYLQPGPRRPASGHAHASEPPPPRACGPAAGRRRCVPGEPAPTALVRRVASGAARRDHRLARQVAGGAGAVPVEERLQGRGQRLEQLRRERAREVEVGGDRPGREDREVAEELDRR